MKTNRKYEFTEETMLVGERSAGCFYGTGEELIKMAYNDSDESGREYERVVKYVESIKQELK